MQSIGVEPFKEYNTPTSPHCLNNFKLHGKEICRAYRKDNYKNCRIKSLQDNITEKIES